MAKIGIKGVIIPNDEQWIYDLFEIEATSPKKVSDKIEKANGEDLEIEINSGGGSVFAGSEIYTAIKEYKGDVIVKVVGIAASAASVIAMAGKKVVMSPTAQMMIHNASGIARGDHNEMTHVAGILKSVNETVANAYRIKSGMDQKSLLSMMEKETWLTPAKAKEYGLIDEIMFENELELVANYDGVGTLPKEIIENIRNKVALQKEEKIEALRTKYKILNLVGRELENE
ncbi:MAG: Clp protease ClpP [Negativicutes bacterium]|nr:Clp protease ClpP [Negativicutes bacterium]